MEKLINTLNATFDSIRKLAPVIESFNQEAKDLDDAMKDEYFGYIDTTLERDLEPWECFTLRQSWIERHSSRPSPTSEQIVKQCRACVLSGNDILNTVKAVSEFSRGRRGKQACIVFHAAKKAGLMLLPSFSAAVKFFGVEGAKGGFYKYIDDEFDYEMIDSLAKRIRTRYDDLQGC